MACGFKVYGLGMTLSILYSTHIQSLEGNIVTSRRVHITECKTLLQVSEERWQSARVWCYMIEISFRHI